MFLLDVWDQVELRARGPSSHPSQSPVPTSPSGFRVKGNINILGPMFFFPENCIMNTRNWRKKRKKRVYPEGLLGSLKPALPNPLYPKAAGEPWALGRPEVTFTDRPSTGICSVQPPHLPDGKQRPNGALSRSYIGSSRVGLYTQALGMN